MSVTFEKAVRKAMKAYWKNTTEFDEMESSKDRKYTKDYFDNVKSRVLNKEEDTDILEPKKSKGKKY